MDIREADFSYNAGQTKFDKPTLILTGRQDNAVGYKDSWGLVENFPRATYAAMDRAGHFLALEQRELMQVLINEWLNREKNIEVSRIIIISNKRWLTRRGVS